MPKPHKKENPRKYSRYNRGFFFFNIRRSQPFGPGYRLLFIPVKPLAQAVSDYAGQYGDYKRVKYTQAHPLSVTSIGAVTHLYYHSLERITIKFIHNAQAPLSAKMNV